MGNVIHAYDIKDFHQFVNDKGVIEIVIRQRNKRIKAFQKVMLSNTTQGQEQGLAEKVIQTLNHNTHLNEKIFKNLGNVARLQKIGLALNALNLCATCVGFAILSKKLSDMSYEINQQLNRIQNFLEKGNDIMTEYTFNKIKSIHSDMLDRQRIGNPYSEEKLREIVDEEYDFLMYLIQCLKKDMPGDTNTHVFLIISMVGMMTASLLQFDEVYYYNNHEKLTEDRAWHLSHDKWMSAYEELSSSWFISKLQDYGAFDTEMTTQEIDIYYSSILDQITDLKEDVTDNQKMIVAMEEMERFRAYREMSNKDIVKSIKKAFQDAGKGLDQATVDNACEKALERAALVY